MSYAHSSTSHKGLLDHYVRYGENCCCPKELLQEGALGVQKAMEAKHL